MQLEGIEVGERKGMKGGHHMQLFVLLNSKCLVVLHLERLVMTLELPTTMGAEEVRKMVWRKLA